MYAILSLKYMYIHVVYASNPGWFSHVHVPILFLGNPPQITDIVADMCEEEEMLPSSTEKRKIAENPPSSTKKRKIAENPPPSTKKGKKAEKSPPSTNKGNPPSSPLRRGRRLKTSLPPLRWGKSLKTPLPPPRRLISYHF